MDKKEKIKFIKKYLLLFSFLLFVGIYSLASFAYLKYLDKYEKDFLLSSGEGFIKTVVLLNKKSELEKKLGDLENTDPAILSLSQEQISCLNDVLMISQKQIENISSFKNIGEVDPLKTRFINFYGNVNSVFSKELKYKHYFNSLNQVIDFLKIAEEKNLITNPEVELTPPDKKEPSESMDELSSLIQEKLIGIIPPKGLEGFHQNLLGLNIDKESRDKEGSQRFDEEIEQIYTTLTAEIKSINQEAEELKKTLSQELEKHDLDPLVVNIEIWE